MYNLLQYVHVNKNSFHTNSNFHTYETRNKNDFTISTHRIAFTNKSHIVLGLSLFNGLPKTLKEISHVKQFNKEVKTLLLNHSTYNLGEFTQKMSNF